MDFIEKLVQTDPLTKLSIAGHELLWTFRYYCKDHLPSKSLIKILLGVHWSDICQVKEIYRLLEVWEPMPPVDALQLLDAQFANRKVRAYAVRCLDTLTDAELSDYLIQLVQALKYEPNHYSPLACWLLYRALHNQMLIGHSFFWLLQAELHVHEIAERFALLLEVYLRSCGAQIDDLHRQLDVVNKLAQIANQVKEVQISKRKQEVQRLLSQTVFPAKFQIPLDPTLSGCGVVISRCKAMDSAKAPLWLVFKNADPVGAEIWLIFKSGDDLRQDVLTLQMLGLMDKIWKSEGLDFRMTPYRCVATGNELGMIETVLNSDTSANIQKKAGGAVGAFKATPLMNWIKDRHPTEDSLKEAVARFTHSCAGYCVATYVLGIGDRHNDNIMINENGFLFHIDFGHFLGNFKKVAGIKKERAPFVLTPEFANVMGSKNGEDFKLFIKLCCDGFIVLRDHASVFINLFAMMLSTGIPELRSEKDIEYLRDALVLDYSRDQASDTFTQLIYQSLDSIATQLNFAMHIFAHNSALAPITSKLM